MLIYMTIGRRIHSTGFCVPCPQLGSRCGLPNGLLLGNSGFLIDKVLAR